MRLFDHAPADPSPALGTMLEGWLFGASSLGTLKIWDGMQFITVAARPALSSVPTTVSSSGVAGEIAADSGHLYICIATNTWRRADLETW